MVLFDCLIKDIGNHLQNLNYALFQVAKNHPSCTLTPCPAPHQRLDRGADEVLVAKSNFRSAGAAPTVEFGGGRVANGGLQRSRIGDVRRFRPTIRYM